MKLVNAFTLPSIGLVLALGSFQRPAHPQVYIPVPIYRHYGAIAYSQSANISGFAWNHSSRRKAEEAALAACKRGGIEGCSLLGWFSNQCSSLATTPQGIHAIKFGLGAPLVEQAALKAYREAGGVNCKTKDTICTGV